MYSPREIAKNLEECAEFLAMDAEEMERADADEWAVQEMIDWSDNTAEMADSVRRMGKALEIAYKLILDMADRGELDEEDYETGELDDTSTLGRQFLEMMKIRGDVK